MKKAVGKEEMQKAQDKKYLWVGLGVIGAVILLLIALSTVFTPNFFRPKATIETYFKESINGLSVGSPVKFQGVPIGQVTDILLSSSAYPEHHINLFSKDKSVAVVRMQVFLDEEGLRRQLETLNQKGLRVQTQLAGLTGTLYLSLSYLDPQLYPPEVPAFPWQPAYPYVPSAISLTNEIIGNLERFFATLDSIRKQVKETIVKELPQPNDGDLKASLEQLNSVAATIKPEDIQRLLASAEKWVTNSSNSLDQIDVSRINDLLKQLTDTAQSLSHIMQNSSGTKLVNDMAKLSGDFNRMVQNNNYDVRTFVMQLQSMTSRLAQLTTEWAQNAPSFTRTAPLPLPKH